MKFTLDKGDTLATICNLIDARIFFTASPKDVGWEIEVPDYEGERALKALVVTF